MSYLRKCNPPKTTLLNRNNLLYLAMKCYLTMPLVLCIDTSLKASTESTNSNIALHVHNQSQDKGYTDAAQTSTNRKIVATDTLLDECEFRKCLFDHLNVLASYVCVILYLQMFYYCYLAKCHCMDPSPGLNIIRFQSRMRFTFCLVKNYRTNLLSVV